MSANIHRFCASVRPLPDYPLRQESIFERLTKKGKDPSCADLLRLFPFALFYGSMARHFLGLQREAGEDLDVLAFVDFSKQQEEFFQLFNHLFPAFHCVLPRSPALALEYRLLLHLASHCVDRPQCNVKEVTLLFEEMKNRFYTQEPFIKTVQGRLVIAHFFLRLDGLSVDLTFREHLPEIGFGLNSFHATALWYQEGSGCQPVYCHLQSDLRGERTDQEVRTLIETHTFASQSSAHLEQVLKPTARSYSKNALGAIFAMENDFFPEESVQVLVQMVWLLDRWVVHQKGEEASLEECQKALCSELDHYLKTEKQKYLFGLALCWLSIHRREVEWEVCCLGKTIRLLCLLQEPAFINRFLLSPWKGAFVTEEVVEWFKKALLTFSESKSSLRTCCMAAFNKRTFLALWFKEPSLPLEELPELFLENKEEVRESLKGVKSEKGFMIALHFTLQGSEEVEWLPFLEANFSNQLPADWIEQVYLWVASQPAQLSCSTQMVWLTLRKLMLRQPGLSQLLVRSLFEFASQYTVTTHRQEVEWNKEANLWSYWRLRLGESQHEASAKKALQELVKIPPQVERPFREILHWLAVPAVREEAVSCFRHCLSGCGPLPSLSWEQINWLVPVLTALEREHLLVGKKQGSLPSNLTPEQFLATLQQVGEWFDSKEPKEQCQMRLFTQWFKAQKEQKKSLLFLVKTCDQEEVPLFLPTFFTLVSSIKERLQLFAELIQRHPTYRGEPLFFDAAKNGVKQLLKGDQGFEAPLKVVHAAVPDTEELFHQEWQLYREAGGGGCLPVAADWDLSVAFYREQALKALASSSQPLTASEASLAQPLVAQLEQQSSLTEAELCFLIRQLSQPVVTQRTVDCLLKVKHYPQEATRAIGVLLKSWLESGRQGIFENARLAFCFFKKVNPQSITSLDDIALLSLAHNLTVACIHQEEALALESCDQLVAIAHSSGQQAFTGYWGYFQERWTATACPLDEWIAAVILAERIGEFHFFIEQGAQLVENSPSMGSSSEVLRVAYRAWNQLIQRGVDLVKREDAQWLYLQIMHLGDYLKGQVTHSELSYLIGEGAFHLFQLFLRSAPERTLCIATLKIILENILLDIPFNLLAPHLPALYRLIQEVGREKVVTNKSVPILILELIQQGILHCDAWMKEAFKCPFTKEGREKIQKISTALMGIRQFFDMIAEIHCDLSDPIVTTRSDELLTLLRNRCIPTLNEYLAKVALFIRSPAFKREWIEKEQEQLIQCAENLWRFFCLLHLCTINTKSPRDLVKVSALFLNSVNEWEVPKASTPGKKVCPLIEQFLSLFGPNLVCFLLEEMFPSESCALSPLSIVYIDKLVRVCQFQEAQRDEEALLRTISCLSSPYVLMTRAFHSLYQALETMTLLSCFPNRIEEIECIPFIHLQAFIERLISQFIALLPQVLQIPPSLEKDYLEQITQMFIYLYLNHKTFHPALSFWFKELKTKLETDPSLISFWGFCMKQFVLIAAYEELWKDRHFFIQPGCSRLQGAGKNDRLIECAFQDLLAHFPREQSRAIFSETLNSLQKEGLLMGKEGGGPSTVKPTFITSKRIAQMQRMLT